MNLEGAHAGCREPSTRGLMQHALGSGQAWLRLRFDLRVNCKGTQAYKQWVGPRALIPAHPARLAPHGSRSAAGTTLQTLLSTPCSPPRSSRRGRRAVRPSCPRPGLLQPCLACWVHNRACQGHRPAIAAFAGPAAAAAAAGP